MRKVNAHHLLPPIYLVAPYRVSRGREPAKRRAVKSGKKGIRTAGKTPCRKISGLFSMTPSPASNAGLGVCIQKNPDSASRDFLRENGLRII